jgi:hypothetical protein
MRALGGAHTCNEILIPLSRDIRTIVMVGGAFLTVTLLLQTRNQYHVILLSSLRQCNYVEPMLPLSFKHQYLYRSKEITGRSDTAFRTQEVPANQYIM